MKRMAVQLEKLEGQLKADMAAVALWQCEGTH